MKIRKFDVYQTAIPFRSLFKHARASRRHSGSIFVRCELDDGTAGFGESLPREYVTGESWRGCFEDLSRRIMPHLIGIVDFHDYGEAESFCAGIYNYLLTHVRELPPRIGAACCAAELALLDAYGRHFHATSFAAPAGGDPVYSGVVSNSGLAAVVAASWKCRRARVPAVKLKVGTSHDLRDARIARAILGGRVSLRVDSNMAWSVEQALAIVPRLQRAGIGFFEQPLPTGHFEDLRRIRAETGAEIIADEDVCDLREARALIVQRACQVFNLRVSKCGGFFNTLRIGRLAVENGVGVQVGCQVGETGLLSAVGLALARRLAPTLFAEGCYGPLLLAEDPIEPDASEGANPFVLGMGGAAPYYSPTSGIGIKIREDRVRQYATAHASVERA